VVGWLKASRISFWVKGCRSQEENGRSTIGTVPKYKHMYQIFEINDEALAISWEGALEIGAELSVTAPDLGQAVFAVELFLFLMDCQGIWYSPGVTAVTEERRFRFTLEKGKEKRGKRPHWAASLGLQKRNPTYGQN